MRAFKVKFLGEGSNDYGGPLREVFDDIVDEVQGGAKGLKVLYATPNNQAGVGEGQDLFWFESGSGDDGDRNDSDHGDTGVTYGTVENKIAKAYEGLLVQNNEKQKFFGKLAGNALRCGIPLPMRLPKLSLWAKMCGNSFDTKAAVAEVDLLLSKLGNVPPGTSVGGCGGFANFYQGLSSVIPTEIFVLFTASELEELFVGRKNLNVALLRECTEYEGLEPDGQIVTWLWEVLEEMTTTEKVKFLRFVAAKSSLPARKTAFEQPFKIQADVKTQGKKQAEVDTFLPHASTCFFALALPAYSTKDILRRKLIQATSLSPTMDADFVTNASELSAGWS